MSRIAWSVVVLLIIGAGAGAPAVLEPQSPPSAPAAEATSLDPDGTARITRAVPVPTTISPEAQEFLATGAAWAPAAGSP